MTDSANKPTGAGGEQASRGRGRPSKDWDALFSEWLKSGLPRREFLLSRGIDISNGTAQKKTQGWGKVIDETAEQLTNMKLAEVGNRKVAAVVEVAEERRKADGTSEPHVAGTPTGASWQMVQKWRSNQANQDFKLADQVRLHIGLILKHGLQQVELPATATAAARKEWMSTLKPGELRLLALAASEVQRMQRLALGLSTENVGIDAVIEGGHVEQPVAAGEDKPRNVFVVELNRNGKFVRARPRQASWFIKQHPWRAPHVKQAKRRKAATKPAAKKKKGKPEPKAKARAKPAKRQAPPSQPTADDLAAREWRDMMEVLDRIAGAAERIAEALEEANLEVILDSDDTPPLPAPLPTADKDEQLEDAEEEEHE